MDWLILQWQNYLLVLLRAGCWLMFWPFWDSRLIPVQVRVLTVLVIALVLTPVVSPSLPPFPGTWSHLVSLAVVEFLLGLSVGICVRFVLAGVQIAGDLAAVLLGFGVVTLYDPQTQAQNTVLADLLVLLTVMVFLSIDGHHMILRLLAHSFTAVPVGGRGDVPWRLFHWLSLKGEVIFVWGVKLAAPVLAALFLTHLALGLVARAVPQIQVMIVSFPLTIALGLLFFSFSLMLAGPFLTERFTGLTAPLKQILLAWQG